LVAKAQKSIHAAFRHTETAASLRIVLRAGSVNEGAKTENGVATDWLKILDEEIQSGNKLMKAVPKVLANPDATLEQVTALFSELEKQAEFVEKLKAVLEGMGHDFPVLDKARALESRYADLAATAAEKVKDMRG
jgi:hypothetical protein